MLTGAVKLGANDNSYAVGGNYFIQIIPMFSPCVDTFNYPSHICHKSTCIIFFYDVLIVAFLKISWHFCVITLLCETSRHIPKSSAFYENIITQLKCPSISIRSWFSGVSNSTSFFELPEINAAVGASTIKILPWWSVLGLERHARVKMS